ncbi:M48 family metallopeptidase [Undibacterium rugosum]|uniref:M48 family metallopeptidase n=1 Tax=Undibacterium rugosum TaxID=2762291 RepID=UPI001B816912|nr:M48 family metallopeptidase [Undibacterium rugosum]MBR7780294.1 M48 family metalloprotease [Undibacterium rugosum]
MQTQEKNLRYRAILIVALWLGFWLIALSLIAGLVWIPYTQIHFRSLNFSGVLAAIAALSLAYALRPRWQKKQHANQVHLLQRDQAPALYALLENIAASLEIKAKVNIQLIAAASAYISPERNWLGQIRSLEVGLGLPLLSTLSERELSTVIAHEFGHFVGGDLSLGPWIYRTRASIANTVYDLDDSIFFLDLLFLSYGKWFLRISASISRSQEFAADALAAQKFGSAASRAALEKVHLIDPMWSAYLDHELGAALQRGAKVPIFDGFRRFCKPGIRRAEVIKSIQRSENTTKTEFDTHPTLAERIQAICPGSEPGMPPLAECLHLTGGEAATEQAWYQSWSQQEIKEVSWERYGVDVVQNQNSVRFSGSWMDPLKLSLSNLPDLAGRIDSLWEQLRPEGVSFLSPMGKRHYISSILVDWICACLTHYGFQLDYVPGKDLILRRDETTISPRELLEQAIESKLSAAYLQQFELTQDAPAQEPASPPISSTMNKEMFA